MAEYIVEYPDDIVSVSHIEECINVHERIVRCRDCKHSEEYSMYRFKNKTFLECTLWHWGDESRLEPEPDGFCAWGKRK